MLERKNQSYLHIEMEEVTRVEMCGGEGGLDLRRYTVDDTKAHLGP